MKKEYIVNFKDCKIRKTTNGNSVVEVSECIEHGTSKVLVSVAMLEKFIGKKKVKIVIEDDFNQEWSIWD
jgi:hypothetical protein